MKKSRIIQGLMRLKDLSIFELESLINFDLNHGINFFDTSSIYNDGESEKKLGEVLKRNPALREKIFIQTKCGIYKNRKEGTSIYDLSYEAIINSLEDSLKRLNTTYVDYFLLHRPDIFIDKEEVLKAFLKLKNEKKVRHFGVSNFSKELIKYLENELDIKIEVDQLQLGIGHSLLIDEIFNFNTLFDNGISRSSDLFFYLKRKNIELQCWSPFQYGMFEGLIFNPKNEKFKELNNYLNFLASKYHVNKSSIAIAYLLSLGQNISVIIGTTKKEHVLDCLNGENLKLTKDEWYKIYTLSGHKLP